MKEHRRILFTWLAMISFVVLFAFLAFGFSQLIAFFNTGAQKADILLLSAGQVTESYKPRLVLNLTRPNDGRAITAGELDNLTRDYVNSYYYLFQATGNKNTAGLKDYFTAKAREKIMRILEIQPREKGTAVSHYIQPLFYSQDGTAAVLNDQQVTYRETKLPRNTLRTYDSAEVEVMLLLEDDFWRIRHKVRKKGSIAQPAWQTPLTNSMPVTTRGKQLLVDGYPFHIKCINYYPRQYPWTAMWENPDSLDLDGDFREVVKLGFNTVRIFIPYHTFSGPEKTGKLRQLRSLLEKAEENDLKVIITLFDFFLDYQVEAWTLADRHLEEVVKAVGNSAALLAWDIKNEPDLDFDTAGEPEVTAWLDFIVSRLKNYDPYHPVTIGWSQPEKARILADKADIISFHFYRSPKELDGFLDTASLPAKPLFLEETGRHSYEHWMFPFSNTEKEQAEYVAEILSISKKYYLHYGIWTLYDFLTVPENVAGWQPWRRNPQKHYGLIDINGRKKQVYKIILRNKVHEKGS